MIFLLIFLLSLVVIFLFGFIIFDKYTEFLTISEKALCGLVVGTVIYLILVYLGSSITKNIFLSTLFIDLFFLLVVLRNYKKIKKILLLPQQILTEKTVVFTTLFFIMLFWWQYPKVLLQPSPLGLHVGRNTYGDTQIHAGIINSLAFAKNFSLNNPFYSGEKMTYYFLTDFLSSILVIYNFSLTMAFLLPSLLFSITLILLLIFLIKRLGGKSISIFLAPFLFLFNSGLGFIYFLKDHSGENLFLALFNINKEYTHLWDKNIQFTNMIGGFLAPERPLILGIPLFLIILLLLLTQKDKKEFNKNLLFASILTGLFPFVHFYFFLTTLTCIAFFSLFDSSRNNLRKWLLSLFIIAFISLPQVLTIFNSVSRHSFIKINFGWMVKTNENILWFWFKNLGIMPLIVVLTLVSKKLKKEIKYWFLPFVFLFLLINTVSFQPYVWDNVKFLIAIYLAAAIIASLYLEKIFQSRLWKKIGVLVSIFFLIISGFISYVGETQPHYLLFSSDDLTLGEFIKNNTKAQDIFLAQTIDKNPVACLAGRTILMGYQGYLWTQGINYQLKEENIKKMLNPQHLGQFKSLALQYKVSYAVINKFDNSMIVNLSFYKDNFPIIYQNKSYLVFRIF